MKEDLDNFKALAEKLVKEHNFTDIIIHIDELCNGEKEVRVEIEF